MNSSRGFVGFNVRRKFISYTLCPSCGRVGKQGMSDLKEMSTCGEPEGGLVAKGGTDVVLSTLDVPMKRAVD